MRIAALSLPSGLALAVLTLAVGTTPAGQALAQGANYRTLGRAGPWEAYSTAARDGTSLCGIAQHTADRGFLLKMDMSSGGIFLHIYRTGWSIPSRARIAVRFEVDGREIWESSFLRAGDRADMIEASFDGVDAAVRFARSFADGTLMIIRFLDGNEGAWRAPLGGTAQVVSLFRACIRGRGETPSPTQPYATTPTRQAPAEQPFGQVPVPGPAPGGAVKAW